MQRVTSKETFDTTSRTAFRFRISLDLSAHYMINSCPLTSLITIAHSKSSKVFVLNRIGKLVSDFRLSAGNSGVFGLHFHKSGLLAVRGDQTVDLVTDFEEVVDLAMECGTPTVVEWNEDGSLLGVGVSDGSLMVYDLFRQKKMFFKNRHSKRVISLAFTAQDLLLSGSEDSQLLVTRRDGSTQNIGFGSQNKPLTLRASKLRCNELSRLYSQMRNSSLKSSVRSGPTLTSVFSNSKNLLLHNLDSNEKPIQLMFAKNYGRVLDYRLFGAGYLIILFEFGQVCLLSLLNEELNNEMDSKKLFHEPVHSFCWADDNSMLVVQRGNTVKFFDVFNFKEVRKLRMAFSSNIGAVSLLSCTSSFLVLFKTGIIQSVLVNRRCLGVSSALNQDSMKLVVKKSYNKLQVYAHDFATDLSNLETAYFVDSNAEIDDFKVSQNYLLIQNKKQIQIFEIVKGQNVSSKYKKILTRDINKKILQAEINDQGTMICRFFDEIQISNANQNENPIKIKIQIKENDFQSMKVDNDFLYILNATSFQIFCLETAEMLYTKTVPKNQFSKFYVSPGDCFFVLLISKDTQKNVFFVVEAPEGSDAGLSMQLLGPNKRIWGELTREFFFEKKQELKECELLSKISTNNIFTQEHKFVLPEKQLIDLRFDHKLAHIFYILFEDLSLETFKVRRDFRGKTIISRIGELNFEREGPETVSLKLDSHLAFVGAENGRIWLYDSEHDLNLETFDARAVADASEGIFSSIESTDALFKVSGPGFQIFESIQEGQIEKDDMDKSQLLTSRLNASKPRSKRPRSQLRSVLNEESALINEGPKGELGNLNGNPNMLNFTKKRDNQNQTENPNKQGLKVTTEIEAAKKAHHELNLNLAQIQGLKTENDVLGSNQLIKQFLELDLVEEAFLLARKNQNKLLLSVTATLALKLERVTLSKKCFRELGNVSMVMSLLQLETENFSDFGRRAEISLFLCDYGHSLMYYFLDGDFRKVLFLCSELKLYKLGIALIKFVRENVEATPDIKEQISSLELELSDFLLQQALLCLKENKIFKSTSLLEQAQQSLTIWKKSLKPHISAKRNQKTKNPSYHTKVMNRSQELETQILLALSQVCIKQDNNSKLMGILENLGQNYPTSYLLVSNRLFAAGLLIECDYFASFYKDPVEKLKIYLKIAKHINSEHESSGSAHSEQNQILNDITSLYSNNNPGEQHNDSKTQLDSGFRAQIETKIQNLAHFLLENGKLTDKQLGRAILEHIVQSNSQNGVARGTAAKSFNLHAQSSQQQRRVLDLVSKLCQTTGDHTPLMKFLLSQPDRLKEAHELFKTRMQGSKCFSNEISMNLLADRLKLSDVPGMRREAVGYLMRCGRERESYILAKATGNVDYFVELLDHSKLSRGESLEICRELEASQKFERAGEVYLFLELYTKALRCYFKSGHRQKCLQIISNSLKTGINQKSQKLSKFEKNLTDISQWAEKTTQIRVNQKCLELYQQLVIEQNSAKKESGSYLATQVEDSSVLSSHLFDGNASTQMNEDFVITVNSPNFEIYKLEHLIELYCHLEKPLKACYFMLLTLNKTLLKGKMKETLLQFENLYQKFFTLKHSNQSSQENNSWLSFEIKKLVRVLKSYLLVKPFVKAGNHQHASRLLQRAAVDSDILGKSNQVLLLTSLVIQAFKVGLNGLAYHWAVFLCKPDNLELIHAKCKSRIQKVALRPVAQENIAEKFKDAFFKGFSPQSSIDAINRRLDVVKSHLNNLQNTKPTHQKDFWLKVEKALVLKKRDLISSPKTTGPAVQSCPSCHCQIHDPYAYSCTGCGFEFEICSFAGLALLSNRRQNSENDFDRAVLSCQRCSSKGYLFGWVFNPNEDGRRSCSKCHIENSNQSFSFKLDIL